MAARVCLGLGVIASSMQCRDLRPLVAYVRTSMAAEIGEGIVVQGIRDRTIVTGWEAGVVKPVTMKDGYSVAELLTPINHDLHPDEDFVGNI